ncbi:MAG: selenocysteine-specific translation elongation factor [Beijerinckiaceae bacterium]
MIIGTAGHIDHGKTSLVRALTGVDTDRLKEEKARGISIDLGFAYLPAPDGALLGFIDVPGHEKFVHNMLAGATGIDFVLLVVAADDGPMPQTIEHLAIVDLLARERGLIALTKIDLMDAMGRAKAYADVARIVRGTCLEGAEIVPVSTVTGEGIDTLRAKLFDAARVYRRLTTEARFRLAIDRSFTLVGVGTIVTGTVLSGSVSVGDRVMVSPSGLTARVRSIHAQNRPAERGVAGERCALNLTGEGISKESVTRGEVVLDPALHAPTNRIDARLRLLATEPKPVGQWMPVRLHHAAAEVGGRIVLLVDAPVPPGGETLVQIVLDQPIAAAAGDRFVVRDTSAQRTIGGGRLLDLRAPMRKRRTPARLAQLDALSLSEPARVLAALLELPPHFADLSTFARDWTLSVPQTASIAEELNIVGASAAGTVYGMSTPAALRLKCSVLAKLQEFHAENPDLPGIALERLRLQIAPALPKPAFTSFLQPLLLDREIGLDGAWVRLAGHEARLTPELETIWCRIMPLISGDQRFRPPRVRDLGKELYLPEADVRRLLKLLGRMGKVDEVAHDHFFLRATVAEMVETIIDLAATAANGEFTAAQFRDRVDNGRKVAIQSLEFLDRHGVTLRRGDLRRVNPHRLDLFRVPRESAGRAA